MTPQDPLPDFPLGLIDTAPVAILVASPDTGQIVESNPAASELFGYSSQELSDLEVTDLHPADEADRYRRLYANRLPAESAVVSQFDEGLPIRILTASGREVPVEVTGWTSGIDGIELVQLMYRDATARLRRERRLTQYRRAIESALDPMAAVDDSFTYLFANEAYCEPLGCDAENVVGRTVSEILGEDIFEAVKPRLDRVLAGEIVRFETTRRYPSGEERDFEVQYYPLETDTGVVFGIAGSMHDVTERNAYEGKLERRNEQLTILNRIVRHDIRNDMNVTLGWTQELKDRILDDELQAMLERIEMTSRHVVDLTKTVRDYVETLGSKSHHELAAVPLRPVLEEELTTRRTTYPEAVFSLEEPVPAIEVRADGFLSSVFRNILNNAVQHNDADIPRVEIRVEEGVEDVTIRIADNGPGIPPDRRDAVFGRLANGLDEPAAGIGLYLVDTLIPEYGGNVWIEDNDPRGAVVVIVLPKAD